MNASIRGRGYGGPLALGTRVIVAETFDGKTSMQGGLWYLGSRMKVVDTPSGIL